MLIKKTGTSAYFWRRINLLRSGYWGRSSWILSNQHSRCLSGKHTTFKPHTVIPLHLKARQFEERVAFIDQYDTHTYFDLDYRAHTLTAKICDKLQLEPSGLRGESVAFLCPNDASYLAAQWSVWLSGGVAVPLCVSHPPSELEYFIEDSHSRIVLTTEEFVDCLRPVVQKLDIPLLVLQKEDFLSKPDMKDFNNLFPKKNKVQQMYRMQVLNLERNTFKKQPAMIVYTSGTTGRPKGVIHTFGSLNAQIEDMVFSWAWTSNDVILHVLPLHHLHGVVNVLMTPLYCGATCVMMPKFDASKVWSTLLAPVTPKMPKSINLFMAVPTVYAKLIENHENRSKEGSSIGSTSVANYVRKTCENKIRLMVSGSAALPEPIMQKWKDITGHTLLERYGMTEFGMGLTNPLSGPRISGTVGRPFPQVEACIARPNVYTEKGYDVIAQGNAHSTRLMPGHEEEVGELYIKGPNLFKEYLNKPDATRETFTVDGWFKTGDTACYTDGVYRILGRSSVDIIKSGGYKISALDVERHLLAHRDIKEVAVVGLPDVVWGQKVAAVVVVNSGATLNLQLLKEWAKDKIPNYQVPSVLKMVDSIPKNAMGKINKKHLVEEVFPKELKMSM